MTALRRQSHPHLSPTIQEQRRACSIVVINLDRDDARLAYISEQLERLGLRYERFPAIDGNNVPEELLAFFRDDKDGFLSAGEKGCYASHLLVYRAMVEGRIAAPALVIEDDIAMPADLPDLLDDVLQAAPADWDFVRLSSPTKRAYVVVEKMRSERRLVRYSITPGSNGALLVSLSGARKFLKQTPRQLPIDQDNRMIWRFDLNMLGVVPTPVRGNSLENSSIDGQAAEGFRNDSKRQRLLRRKRSLWRRHAWNIEKFGVGAWLAAELANVVVTVLPRRVRPKFLATTGELLSSIARKPR